MFSAALKRDVRSRTTVVTPLLLNAGTVPTYQEPNPRDFASWSGVVVWRRGLCVGPYAKVRSAMVALFMVASL